MSLLPEWFPMNIDYGETMQHLSPSIFCPICQTTDTRSATIKLHMESKREVQCKSCKLYFANCFSLGKHRKGRCRDKKAREENFV